MNGRGVLIQNICYHVPENQVLLTAAGKVDAIINDPVIIPGFPHKPDFRLTLKIPVLPVHGIRKKIMIHYARCNWKTG